MAAAVAGGVTSLVCPPDTDPVLDEPGLVEMLKFRAEQAAPGAALFPLGALTRGLAGEALTEMAELTEAGCVGFCQADVAAGATRWCCSARCSTPRPSATRSGCGRRTPAPRQRRRRQRARWPRAWACPACRCSPRRSRCTTIFELVRDTGARVHLCRLSSAAGVELVRARQGRGPAGDLRRQHQLAAPDRRRHRLLRRRMRLTPPLRQQRDRDAMRAGAGRRHHRRAGSRPHAGRRGRQDTCRSPKPSPAPPGSSCCWPGAEVGRRRAALGLARALARGDAASRRACSARRSARWRRAPAGWSKAASPTSACSTRTRVDGRRREALRSQGKHTPFARLRAAGPGALHASSPATVAYEALA